jgi:hypothetical protein
MNAKHSPVATALNGCAEPRMALLPESTPGTTVHVARSVGEVEAIREVWSAWNNDRDTDIDFCLQYVWERDGFIRPHVIVIYRDGRPDAMLVGRLEHSRTDLKIGYFRLLKVRTRLLTFAHGGLLGNDSPENSEQFLKSISNALRNGEAEMALLHQIGADTCLYQKALTVPGFATRDYLVKPSVHNVMKLPGTIDEVYGALSGGHRSELRRKRKKILKVFSGSVAVRCFREPDELEDALSDIEQIAAKSYQRGLGVGFQDSEQMRHRLRLCAQKGWLRIYLLTLDSKASAFWAGTVYKGRFCSDYLGFDSQFGDYSPGTFLLTEMIDDLCRSGVREIDFGLGAGRYKERFGNSKSAEASIYIYAPTLKGFALNALRTVTGLVDDVLRSALERTNLLPRIKKLWRMRLAGQAIRSRAT